MECFHTANSHIRWTKCPFSPLGTCTSNCSGVGCTIAFVWLSMDCVSFLARMFTLKLEMLMQSLAILCQLSNLFCFNQTLGLKIIVLIADGDCGEYHTLLLTQKNDVFSFGGNGYHQCCARLNLRCVRKPYEVTRSEMGVSLNCWIERVIANRFSTLVVVDANVFGILLTKIQMLL